MNNFLRGGRELPIAYGIWPTAFITIFCVLFSNAFRFRSLIGAKGLFVVLFVAISSAGVQAQQVKPTEHSLYIGDTLPESFWAVKHQVLDSRSFKIAHKNLNAYKDKLIVLEFWSSGCGACFASLKKLKEIKLANPNLDFHVVPVTYQTPVEKGTDFLKLRIKQQEFLFNSVVSDSIIHALFPHRGIPHMVWIYKGKVIAKPKWDYATAANFEAVLAGNTPRVYNQLSDNAIDPEQDFFTPGNGATKVLHKQGGVQIARYLPDFQFEEPKIIRTNNKTIFYAINSNLEMMLYEAFKAEIFPALNWREGSGLTWLLSETKRNTLFKERVKLGLNGGLEEDLKYDAWAAANMYCFAVTLDGNVSDKEIRKRFQEELNSWLQRDLGLYAEIQNQKVLEYAVLKSANQRKSIQSFGKSIRNVQKMENGFLYATYGQFYQVLFSKAFALTDKPLSYGMLIDHTEIAAEQSGGLWLPRTRQMSLAEMQDLLAKYHLYLTFKQEKVPSLLIQEIKSPYKPSN